MRPRAVDPYSVSVILTARLPPHDPDPAEGVTHYQGRIYLYNSEDAESAEGLDEAEDAPGAETDIDVAGRPVGSFVAREVNLTYEDADDASNFEVMDDEQSLHDLDCIIQRHWDDIRMEGQINGLVFIENVKIDPKHRGRGIGAAALDRAITHWENRAGNNPSHIFLKAYPVEHLKWKDTGTGPHEIVEDEAFLKGRDRLRRLYGRLGFTLIPGTDYMVLCTAFKRPTLESVEA